MLQSNDIHEEIRLKYGELLEYRCAMVLDGRQSAMVHIMQAMWDEVVRLRGRVSTLEADRDDE